MPSQTPSKRRSPKHGASSREAVKASRVDLGAPTPELTPDKTTVGVLEKALTIIGTTERSMKPAVLARYPAVLDSTEVKRRLAEPANKGRDTAQVAHEALKDAIASQRDDIDCLIGTAALADHPDFEGKLVYQRKDILTDYKPVSCSEDQYKDRRPTVLHFIAHYMAYGRGADDERAEKPNVGPLVPKQHQEAISALTCVVNDVLIFAEVCAVYVRTRTIDEALQKLGHDNRLRRHRPALLGPLWRAYRELVVSSTCCFGDLSSPAVQEVHAYLPRSVVEVAKRILVDIDSYVDVRRDERQTIFAAHTEGISTHSLPSYRKRLNYRPPGTFVDVHLDREPGELRIREILEVSRILYTQLRNYTETVDRVWAAEPALDAAAHYYGVDLSLKMPPPLLGSLRDQIRIGIRDDSIRMSGINSSKPSEEGWTVVKTDDKIDAYDARGRFNLLDDTR